VSGFVDRNRKTRLGIAGCGKAFERLYLPALNTSAEWELVGVCDTSQERCEWVRSLFDEISVYDSIEPLLDEIRLDAMFILTPPETHCELTVKALERGLHVLVEKPMALNPEEAITMVRLSKLSGRHLRVGFNRRFRRPYMNVRDKLAKVPTENIRSISFKFIFSLSRWKSVTFHLGDDSRGEGVLDDVASHVADVLIWLTGAKVSRVKAEPLSGSVGREIVVRIEMKFENGIVAKGIVGHGPRWSEQVEIQMYNRRFVVFPVGMVETQRMPEYLLNLYSYLRTRFHYARHRLGSTHNLTHKSISDQLREFARVIRDEAHSGIGADGMSGYDVVRVTSACRESIRSGGIWVSITDSSGSRS
jgi:predicted dehydrogenase